MDGVNARYLDASMLPAAPAVLVCDASFISLKKLLPAALALAAPMAFLVALIKPQFEVGKGRVGKGGVVRDAALHRDVVADIEAWLVGIMGWRHIGTVPSTIDGPDGNREFCLSGKRQGLISPAETRTGRDVASTNQPRQATSSPRQPARRECQHMGHAALWSRHRHFDHQHRSICVASRSMTSV